MPDVNILGYQIQAMTAAECVRVIGATLQGAGRNCMWLACINPHSYAVARDDDAFKNALSAADWLVPDGVGVVIASWILRKPIPARVTGSEIFEGVMAHLNTQGGSVFFLGSTEQTLAHIAEKLSADYPNVRLAGVYSPPFKAEFSSDDNAAMIDAVVKSGADVLWVGMTAPKQEKWIAAHRENLPVKFAGAIGAVFDFYTGNVKRSHPLFQKLGLEWLPRLVQQPRRLWRRMFISAPIFLFDVSRERLGRGAKKTNE